MPILPQTIMPFVTPFRPLFHPSTWEKGQTLLVGSILAVGKRTVTAALRVRGLSQERQFAKYHHVLNRAVWSPYRAALILLRLLLAYLDSDEGPLLFGLDETIERRWGAQISARGIYRAAVRSSQSHFVKTSGLRWLSVMWLSAIPWAQRVWALPVRTLLAPSEGYYEDRVRSPKKLTDWARQVIKQLRRWLPQRQRVVVADDSYAALDLWHACQQLAMITRLRLDAALYDPAPPYPGVGRPAKQGARLPTLESVLHNTQTVWATMRVPGYDGQVRTLEIVSETAVWYHSGKPLVPLRGVLVRDPQAAYEPVGLLSTDPDRAPPQIVSWFVQRWRLEVTFEEVRTPRGAETQRQWSDKAIARTTPLLVGLFSWITLAAHLLVQEQHVTVRRAAWYAKVRPTFSDAIRWVRYRLWLPPPTFSMSPASGDMLNVPRPLFDRLVDTVCYAA